MPAGEVTQSLTDIDHKALCEHDVRTKLNLICHLLILFCPYKLVSLSIGRTLCLSMGAFDWITRVDGW